jgi:hypothetical protein
MRDLGFVELFLVGFVNGNFEREFITIDLVKNSFEKCNVFCTF